MPAAPLIPAHLRDVSAERATAQRLASQPYDFHFHPSLTGFIEKTFVITEFELRKLRHDFTELITAPCSPRSGC